MLDGKRWIEDYRDDHEGDIWIIAPGTNLMKYPDSFFDGKISIALNFSFIAFPRSTYLCMFHQAVLDLIIKYKPDFLKKCLLNWPLEMLDSLERLGKYKDWPIYMHRRMRPSNPAEMIANVEAIVQKKSTEYYCIHTIAHVAIQAAAVFGAKRIILVACEHKLVRGLYHAQSRGMWFFYPHTLPPSVARMQEHSLGANTLAQAFRGHGIEVLRHYLPEDRFEKVEFDVS